MSARALAEKMNLKLAICVLKSDAVKKTISWERATPRTMPRTSAAADTMTVSSAMTRATWPRVMPSTW